MGELPEGFKKKKLNLTSVDLLRASCKKKLAPALTVRSFLSNSSLVPTRVNRSDTTFAKLKSQHFATFDQGHQLLIQRSVPSVCVGIPNPKMVCVGIPNPKNILEKRIRVFLVECAPQAAIFPASWRKQKRLFIYFV